MPPGESVEVGTARLTDEEVRCLRDTFARVCFAGGPSRPLQGWFADASHALDALLTARTYGWLDVLNDPSGCPVPWDTAVEMLPPPDDGDTPESSG